MLEDILEIRPALGSIKAEMEYHTQSSIASKKEETRGSNGHPFENKFNSVLSPGWRDTFFGNSDFFWYSSININASTFRWMSRMSLCVSTGQVNTSCPYGEHAPGWHCHYWGWQVASASTTSVWPVIFQLPWRCRICDDRHGSTWAKVGTSAYSGRLVRTLQAGKHWVIAVTLDFMFKYSVIEPVRWVSFIVKFCFHDFNTQNYHSEQKISTS